MCGKKTTERIAVFFQDFSRKQVDICTQKKMKQYFLSGQNATLTDGRSAGMQENKLMN